MPSASKQVHGSKAWPLYKHLFHRHQSPQAFSQRNHQPPNPNFGIFPPPGPGNKIVSLALGSASCQPRIKRAWLFVLVDPWPQARKPPETNRPHLKKEQKKMASTKQVECEVLQRFNIQLVLFCC